jgi:hypothetical protein
MKRKIASLFALALLTLSAQAQDALPWPPPDAWSPFVYNSEAEVQRYGNPYSNKMLLDSTSVYVQSSLPPQDASLPKWFSSRFQVTSPEAAELYVYVKHSDVAPPLPLRPLGWAGLMDTLTEGSDGKTDQERAAERSRAAQHGSVWILVTDKTGTRINVSVEETADGAWSSFQRAIAVSQAQRDSDLRTQEKARLKAEKKELKERKKQSKQ